MAGRIKIKIEILPTARIDLKEIVDFIAQGSLKYAKLEKRLIIQAIDKLAYFPDLGTSFDYRSVEARQLVFKNYLIIYRLRHADLLEILTIHHHARSVANNPAFNIDDDE